jgi:AraC-like DNA-binding protein
LQRHAAKSGRRPRGPAGRLSLLPTAGGGIARAAYARASAAGLDARALLGNAGLTLAQIAKTDIRLPVKSQIRFLNDVATALDDAFLGIHLAQSVDLRELGLVYYVLASSQDLDTALTRLARYSAIQNEGVHIRVGGGEGLTVSFEYVGVGRTSDRHQIEFFVAFLLRLCRHLTGRDLAPERVRLMHWRSKLAPDLKTFFGCAVEFGATVDRVVFPLDLRHTRLTHVDPYLNGLMLSYCDEALSHRRARPGDWRLKVENAIAPLLPHGEATIETVAQRLGMSQRTLARRLGEEGVSFLDVLRELRLRLAQQYLREPDISIAQVAWLLGYRGPSAFTHAFKRWTGQSPRRMRAVRRVRS